MFEHKYQLEEISSARMYLRNKSFWRKIGADNVAKVVEQLNSSGKIVAAVIPTPNRWTGDDYLIILHSP